MNKYRFTELVRNCLSKDGPTLTVRFRGGIYVVLLSGIWMDGGSQDKIVYKAKARDLVEQCKQADRRRAVMRKWMSEVPQSGWRS